MHVKDEVKKSLTSLSVEKLVEESIDLLPRCREDLPSRVSHGIRTPVTSILGYEEILKESEGMPESDRARFHNIVEAERERLARLLTCIRMFQKIERKELRLEISYDDAGFTIGRAVDIFRWSAEERGIELRFQAPVQGIQVVADHRQLQFSAELLIANALEVTSRGGRVSVVVKKVSNGLSVSVEDTGLGVRRDDLPTIFLPFMRVVRSDESGAELGIGLTIARHLVALHSGRLDAFSIPEKGSRFRILIPA